MAIETYITGNIAFTRHSVVTALLIFTILSILGVFLVLIGGWRTLPYLGFGFLLCLVRLCLPIEINPAVEITYPQFMNKAFLFFERELWYGVSVYNIVVVFWLLVAAALLIRLICRMFQQNKMICRASLPEDDPYFMLCVEVGASMGCKKKPQVCVLPKYFSPMMAGFIRPRVILPDYVDVKDLRLVLRHEYAHYLGRDLWIKMTMNILCCLLWWNPAVYFLRRGVDQTLEMRSDFRACNGLQENERIEFALAMCRYAKMGKGKSPTISCASKGRPANYYFSQRISEISYNSKSCVWSSVVLLLIAMALFVSSYVFILQPRIIPPNDCASEYSYQEVTELILRHEDGRLEYYCDGYLIACLTEEDLNKPPYNTVPIYDVSLSNRGE